MMRRSSLYANLMLGLLALFAFRVIAQFIQWVWPLSWLPPFDEWHGSVLPYAVLLTIQVAILVVFLSTVLSVRRGRIQGSYRSSRIWFVLGATYFTVMAGRLIGGLTIFAGHAWFAKPIPAVFHLVLAAGVLIFSRHLWDDAACRSARPH